MRVPSSQCENVRSQDPLTRLAHRVVSRVQRLWVSDLRTCPPSAAGCATAPPPPPVFGVSSEPLVVSAEDDLADCCALGQAVHVVGFASQRAAGSSGGGGNAGAGVQPMAKTGIEVGPSLG
jgi:hypothetical protein